MITTLLVATGLTAGALLAPAPAGAAVTTVPMTGRASVSTNGLEVGPTGGVDTNVLVDATGRYVFFSTTADLLDDSLGLPDHDTNGKADVYRRDRLTETTERVSFAGQNAQIDGESRLCGISPDGRYVGWLGTGTNLPGGASLEVYVRDLQNGTTGTVSLTSANQPAAGVAGGQPCPMDDNGYGAAFVSNSKDVVTGDTNGTYDVFLRRFPGGTTERVSLNSAGGQIASQSLWPAMSGSGNAVAFQTTDPNVVSGDLNGTFDVFVRKGNATVRASAAKGGGNAEGGSTNASLSTDGRYVAFSSTAANLTFDDDNGTDDVFRKDLDNGSVLAASVKTGTGAYGDLWSRGASITGDGRYVGFVSAAKNLYPDPYNVADAFRHDFTLNRTDLVSRVGDSIAPGNKESSQPTLSADGRVAAFASNASDLTAGDLDGARDAFVRDFALDIAPFSSPKDFLGQQYEDFLGQPAGSLGPNAGQVLTHGLHDPDHLIVLSAHNSTWAGKRGPLVRLYWAFFLRVPDPSGMEYWTKKLTNGTKLAAVASQFAASSEFKTKYGSLSNEVFVTKIYENIFNREPDADGLAYWTKKLDTKAKTRGDVMVNFSESSEGQRVLAPQADTVLIHLGLLGKMPTTLYVQLVVGDPKNEDWTPELLARSLRTSADYAARVSS